MDALAPGRDTDRRLTVVAALAGLAVSAGMSLSHPEGAVHADDVTHYLYARWAWSYPSYLLDEWGRPGFTALYFLPAWLGWPACRLLSASLTAGSAYLAFAIARELGMPRAWLASLLAFAQPLFFQLSQSTLTETPLAFYLALAGYLAIRGRWSASAAILSMTLVTRHEAVVFVPVWLGAAWAGGVRWRRLWPIIWAPLLVNGLGLIFGRGQSWELFLSPRPTTQYGHGGWLTFFARSLEACGPGIAALAILGLPRAFTRRGGMLVCGCVGVYFAAQTVIRALGLYGSGGYARFLVPVCPLVAVMALEGWHRLRAADSRDRRRAVLAAGAAMVLLWAAMERQLVLHRAAVDLAAELPELHLATWAMRIATAVVAAIVLVVGVGPQSGWRGRMGGPAMATAIAALIVLAVGALCHPLSPVKGAEQIDKAQKALASRGLSDRLIISAHCWMDYVAGRPLPPDRPTVRRQLELAPAGTLLAWERQFAGSEDHGLTLAEFAESRHYRLILESAPLPGGQEPYLRVFEKLRQ